MHLLSAALFDYKHDKRNEGDGDLKGNRDKDRGRGRDRGRGQRDGGPHRHTHTHSLSLSFHNLLLDTWKFTKQPKPSLLKAFAIFFTATWRANGTWQTVLCCSFSFSFFASCHFPTQPLPLNNIPSPVNDAHDGHVIPKVWYLAACLLPSAWLLVLLILFWECDDV